MQWGLRKMSTRFCLCTRRATWLSKSRCATSWVIPRAAGSKTCWISPTAMWVPLPLYQAHTHFDDKQSIVTVHNNALRNIAYIHDYVLAHDCSFLRWLLPSFLHQVVYDKGEMYSFSKHGRFCHEIKMNYSPYTNYFSRVFWNRSYHVYKVNSVISFQYWRQLSFSLTTETRLSSVSAVSVTIVGCNTTPSQLVPVKSVEAYWLNIQSPWLSTGSVNCLDILHSNKSHM